ncbi:MAG: hypothetical protein PHP96_01600 [Candidatus Dojkabacteria bacterium]|nr:hypothetical protein [Candidatus Dojkabacteria bacterium]MDD4560994.1 hypothetical protein [Candidatus Dojkabacteria bacterium]
MINKYKILPENAIKKVWKEIIKLQYRKGCVVDINLYKEGLIDEKGLATIIQKLKSLGLLEYVNESEKTGMYYVAVPDILQDSIFQEGFYINKNTLDGEILKEFSEEAIHEIDNLTVRTEPLGIDTPPPLDMNLIREEKILKSFLANLKSKIDIHTLGTKKTENPDSDRIEISYTYEKRDRNRVRFIISFSNTFLRIQELEGIDLKQIESYFADVIGNYINENNFNLGYSTYILKCICSIDNITADCIQISNIEDLKNIKIKDLVFERHI